jgi:hypothetical protein
MSMNDFPRGRAVYGAHIVRYDAAACPTATSPTVINVRVVVA